MYKSNHVPIILCLLLPLTILNAQDENLDLKMACEKYQICLKTGHDELIISTLIHLMKAYHQYPDHDYSCVISTLDSLTKAIDSEKVRMMSLLTKEYLSSEKDLDWMMGFSYEEIYNFLTISYVSSLNEIYTNKSPVF